MQLKGRVISPAVGVLEQFGGSKSKGGFWSFFSGAWRLFQGECYHEKFQINVLRGRGSSWLLIIAF